MRGVTTNPTILANDGVTGGWPGIEKHCKEIAQLIDPLPLSVEVTTNEFDEMREQALRFRTWALEYAPYQIRVNAVAPGFTRTAKLDTVPDDVLDGVRQRTPLRRFATPEEIASAYCFLASDEASFITGQVLFVDGGLSCGF